MQDWSRPDPLTRDLIHLINARRHDHWDVDVALDTLTELIEQGREEEILTVLAALDEDMAEWLFDLLAEAASTIVGGDGEEEAQGGSLLTIALPLQANFEQPLRLTADPEETAALLRRYLHLSHESQVVVEPKLLTDTTLERLSLQGLHAHVETVFSGTRSRPFAARLHTPMEHTVYLLFGVREEGEPTVPQELGPEEQEGLLQGLRAQCGDLAPAPHLLEAPVYAAYALFDAKNSVGLQRLADETIAVWRELTPAVRGRVMVHLHTQCGNGVYMPVWTDLLDPAVGGEDAGPLWTSPDVWVFTADLPIEWPGEVLTNRLLAEGCTRFENHIVEAADN